MISFQNITKIYAPDVVALKGVSFEVKESEFVLIVGRSGAGKTTLIKLLVREEDPSEGKIFCFGCDMSKIRQNQLCHIRRKIGIIFQDYKLLSSKTVFENMAYAMEVAGAEDDEIKRDISRVLDLVGLEKKQKSFPEELSGGEQQRVAIARALIHRPEIIVADEPTGNLDPYNTKDIIDLLKKINTFGTTVIVSTHDKKVVDMLKKRVITLEDGEIVKDEKRGRFIL